MKYFAALPNSILADFNLKTDQYTVGIEICEPGPELRCIGLKPNFMVSHTPRQNWVHLL